MSKNFHVKTSIFHIFIFTAPFKDLKNSAPLLTTDKHMEAHLHWAPCELLRAFEYETPDTNLFNNTSKFKPYEDTVQSAACYVT